MDCQVITRTNVNALLFQSRTIVMDKIKAKLLETKLVQAKSADRGLQDRIQTEQVTYIGWDL